VALLADAFGTTSFGAIQLPGTSGSGTPAVSDWVTAAMPNTPDSASWIMPRDPHGINAYVSPNTLKDIGLLVNDQRTYLAMIDLQALLAAPRTAEGHVAVAPLPAGVVTFISVH